MPIMLPLLLAAAVAPAPAVSRDVAGNVMLRLTPAKGPEWYAAKPGERSAMMCTTTMICLQASRRNDHWEMVVYAKGPPAHATSNYPIDDDDGEPDIWPYVIVYPGGAMLTGHIATQSTGYSGGGASSSTLAFQEIPTSPYTTLRAGRVAWSGSASIRACFGARDSRTRAGACSDEYSFATTLRLDPTTRSGRPRLRLTTVAKTFPGRLSRQADNTTKRLARKDLFWWRDPVCSYSRLLVRNDAKGGYALDRPAPVCADYLEL